MEPEYIKISEYAKRMSMQTRTAYRQFHSGKVEGYQDEDTGTIYILSPFKETLVDTEKSNQVVLYARVSSNQNKTNLETQMERLRY